MERTKASRHAVVDPQSFLAIPAQYRRLFLSCRASHARSHLYLRMALGERVPKTFRCFMRNACFGVRALLQLLQSHLQREHLVLVGVGCL